MGGVASSVDGRGGRGWGWGGRCVQKGVNSSAYCADLWAVQAICHCIGVSRGGTRARAPHGGEVQWSRNGVEMRPAACVWRHSGFAIWWSSDRGQPYRKRRGLAKNGDHRITDWSRNYCANVDGIWYTLLLQHAGMWCRPYVGSLKMLYLSPVVQNWWNPAQESKVGVDEAS